jgi:replication factor A1
MLTAGIIQKTFDDTVPDKTEPIVQILEIKRLGTNAAMERYRICISDGEYFQQGMLATQLNHFVSDETIKENSVIKLTEFLTTAVANRKIVIILGLRFISQESSVIGDPKNIEGAPTTVINNNNNSSSSNNSNDNNNNSNVKRKEPASAVTSSPVYTKRVTNPGHDLSKVTNFHPISSLNLYQNRWVIKARVTAKSSIRTWSNKKGEGKLFSVDLLDSSGGQLKATMFKDAVDKFHRIFEVDKVFIISKGTLKIADKKFNTIPNEYELTLNVDSDVQAVDDDTSIQTQTFEFNTIDKIKEINPNDSTDIIGIVTVIHPIGSIVTKKTQKEMMKRTIVITDQSCSSIELTFWGEQAQEFNENKLSGYPVIAVKSCKVSDFGGKSLSTSFSSQVFINPDRNETRELRNWWDTQGHKAEIDNLSNKRADGSSDVDKSIRKTLSCIKDEHLGMKNFKQPDYFTCRATITHFKGDFENPPYYNSCPGKNSNGKDCQKKVEQDGNGWRCNGCNRVYSSSSPRYVLSLTASDPTGSSWLSAFNDQAAQILNVTAQQLHIIKESGNDDNFKKIFEDANFKQYVFVLKVGQSNTGDEIRSQTHIVSISAIDYKKECRLLVDSIEQYM